MSMHPARSGDRNVVGGDRHIPDRGIGYLRRGDRYTLDRWLGQQGGGPAAPGHPLAVSNPVANQFSTSAYSLNNPAIGYSQSFSVPSNANLYSVKFSSNITNLANTPSGNFAANLYAATGAAGSVIPTGAALAVATGVGAAGLPQQPASALIEFVFPGGFPLVGGTTYCVSFETGTTNVGGVYSCGVGWSNGDKFPAGNPGYYYSGVWHANIAAGYDMIFYIYTQ